MNIFKKIWSLVTLLFERPRLDLTITEDQLRWQRWSKLAGVSKSSPDIELIPTKEEAIRIEDLQKLTEWKEQGERARDELLRALDKKKDN